MNEIIEVTPEIKEAMETLLEYMEDEHTHYLSSELDDNEKKNHVWYLVSSIANWMGIDIEKYERNQDQDNSHR